MVEELGVQVRIWVFYQLIKVLVQLLEPGHRYCLHRDRLVVGLTTTVCSKEPAAAKGLALPRSDRGLSETFSEMPRTRSTSICRAARAANDVTLGVPAATCLVWGWQADKRLWSMIFQTRYGRYGGTVPTI